MKLIIAGSRGFLNYRLICETLEATGFDRKAVTEVVSGGANGADKLGERWAVAEHIPVVRFKADQNANGKYAAVIRNAAMVEYADACIVFWDGASKGSRHIIDLATEKSGMRLVVVTATDVKLVSVEAALQQSEGEPA